MGYNITYKGYTVNCDTKKELDDLVEIKNEEEKTQQKNLTKMTNNIRVYKGPKNIGETVKIKRAYNKKKEYKWYTIAEEKKLEEMINKGYKISEIAKELNRKQESIYNKMKGLGLRSKYYKMQDFKRVVPAMEIRN